MSFYFEPINNNTGAMTINIDACGAVAIVTAAGNALANADLRAGRLYTLVYNGTAMVVSGSNVGEDAESGTPLLLVDAYRDDNVDVTSNADLHEELVESYTFTTYEDNVEVYISIAIPLVVFTTSMSGVNKNGACRCYLDGDAYNFFPSGAKQWNGLAIANAGQWVKDYLVPVDTMVNSPKIRHVIPSAGVHTIRVHIAGSTTDTVVSLHGRRRFQVEQVKAAKGDPGAEGMTGASALTIVRTMAISNIDIATGLENGDTVNGVLLATGDRVLLAAQTASAENGIYVVQASGAATRHPDFATYDSNIGPLFSVRDGTVNKGTLWYSTSNVGGTIGTTALAFARFNAPVTSVNGRAGAVIVPEFNENEIINGNFDIWQRATSQTSSGYGSADRWNCINSGSTKNASQSAFIPGQTDVPGGPRYFLRTAVTSVAAAGNFAAMSQPMAGVEMRSGRKVTVTFWAKADAARQLAYELTQFFGTGGSPSAQVNGIGAAKVSLTTAWQKFQAVIDVPSIVGKTLGTAGNDFLGLYFWFDAGSNFNARTSSLGQQSGTFDIAHVSVMPGDWSQVDDPFPFRSWEAEERLCLPFCEIKAVRTENGSRHIQLVRKRGTPTVSVSVGSSGNVTRDGFELTHTAAADCTVTATAEM
jgi:hypothetical protein